MLTALTGALSFSTFATMIVGAIGNDGAGNYDNSLTVTASYDSFSSRAAINAFNGSGIEIIAGQDGDQVDEYQALAGSGSFGEDWNWMGREGASSNSLGWVMVDLGASFTLEHARVFNFAAGSAGRSNRGTDEARVWYHDGASEPNANNTDGNDTDFDSTGWTQLGSSSFNFTQAPGNSANPNPDVVNFGDTSARFVAFEILSNHGDSTTSQGGPFVGLQEVQFFESNVIPEPSAAGLLLLGCLLIRRIARRA